MIGFDQSDFLTCCKFAEGDSRVLMQKMSRDRYRLFLKNENSKALCKKIFFYEVSFFSIKEK